MEIGTQEPEVQPKVHPEEPQYLEVSRASQNSNLVAHGNLDDEFLDQDDYHDSVEEVAVAHVPMPVSQDSPIDSLEIGVISESLPDIIIPQRRGRRT